jgi:hypothetical protein
VISINFLPEYWTKPDGKWNPEAAGTRAGLPAAWMSMNPTQEVKNFVTNSQSD